MYLLQAASKLWQGQHWRTVSCGGLSAAEKNAEESAAAVVAADGASLINIWSNEEWRAIFVKRRGPIQFEAEGRIQIEVLDC